MEFYISPHSGQFYMINVLENQWLSVTYNHTIEASSVLLCVRISVTSMAVGTGGAPPPNILPTKKIKSLKIVTYK